MIYRRQCNVEFISFQCPFAIWQGPAGLCGLSKVQFRLYLKHKKRRSVAQTLKRKAVGEDLGELRQQRRVLDNVCAILENDTNMAEEAEGKALSQMAQYTQEEIQREKIGTGKNGQNY